MLRAIGWSRGKILKMGPTLHQWTNFYILIGTAAVTLIGLIFIALTFGQKLVMPETVGTTRALLSPIIYHFIHVFLITCMALIPVEGPEVFAATTVVTTLVRLSMIPGLMKRLIHLKKTEHDIEVSDWVLNVVLPVILYVLMMTSGVALWSHLSWSYFGIAFSAMGLLVLAVGTAWDMLVWMASVTE